MSAKPDALPLRPGVRVLAEHPCGLLAVDKPEDVLSHPNGSEDNARSVLTANYSLDEEAYHVRDGKGGIRRVWLINRLDGPTSGVLLLATTESAAIAARKAFASRAVAKGYLAVCVGRNRLPALRGTWDDLLVTRRGGPEGARTEPVMPGQPARGPTTQALTHVRVGSKGEGAVDLVQLHLEPKTGRTHQLRVQCAMRGHPILGDKTYGDFEANRALGAERGFRRLFLHAESLELSPFIGGERIRFAVRSPAPSDFAAVLGQPQGPAGAKGLGTVRV